MSDYLKNFFAAEWAKLKEMTLKEKASYIWEYYKIQIITALIIIFLAGNLINVIWINPPKKLYLQLGFYGSYVDDAALDSMCGQIENAVMTSEELQTMQITGIYFIVDSNDPQMNMANQEKFMAMISAREIDMYVANETDFYSLVSEGFCLPLNEVLSDRQMSQLSDKLIIGIDNDNIETEYGIKLDDSQLFTDNGIPVNGQYLAVVVNSDRLDNVNRVIELIYGS